MQYSLAFLQSLEVPQQLESVRSKIVKFIHPRQRKLHRCWSRNLPTGWAADKEAGDR